MKRIVVAIDGFSSCGKSTMARNLAKTVNYTFIDSGAMYRAVTLYALCQGFFEQNRLNEERLREKIHTLDISFIRNPETGQNETFLNGENVENAIRSMEVANKVSRIAALSFVRSVLVVKQQELGKGKAVVMDGRDIGTVVFPEAELKIFVTALPEVRAQRRVDELSAKGLKVQFEEVLFNVCERDRIDTSRQDSPLRKADDAIELDNSYLTIDEQQKWLLEQFIRATTV
ncbi:MAG: (d)CMP kinase [Tannerella sp.]|jgi:cytidylate kinase|nr:(d)CMP kinase [Tannerella sp.]